jgi:predicted dehydrogenase
MRIAIFGAGVIGKLRADTVRSNPGTELVGVADVDEGRAQALAGGSGARASADYRTLLEGPAPDAVIVASPVHLHEEMCVAAFAAGAHVLCEKPLSNSLSSCRRIQEAAEAAGRTLATGFNHRFYPSVKFLAQVLRDGRIGQLDHLRVFGGHDGTGSFKQDWMFKGELSGGGAMMDVGIHMTDLVNHLAGDIVEVAAISTGNVWKVDGSEDNAMAVMRTSGGTPVIYQATWTEWKRYQIFIEAYGDRGMVRAAYAPMANLLITQDKPGGARSRTRKLYPEIILREKLKGWETTTRQTFVEELDDFLRMVDGEAVRLADGRAGVLAVEVADAVYRSSAERRTVTLGEG